MVDQRPCNRTQRRDIYTDDDVDIITLCEHCATQQGIMTSLEEAVLSSRVVCSDSLSSCASDTASDAGIRSDRCDSSCFSGSLSSYAGSVSSSPSRESRLVMDDRDKGIYNRLGSKSGTEGKVKRRLQRVAAHDSVFRA